MISEALLSDAEDIHDIEVELFHNPTSVNVIKKELTSNPFMKYFVYKYNNNIIGFCSFNIMYEQAEIVNFGISKAFQNQGKGRKLISKVIDYITANGVIRITLEVNINNEIAIKLYEFLGFKKISIRKGYYNGQDALLLALNLKEDYNEYISN